ncbi:hypothetical protein AVEN_160881-1 [Araneus ventricosus]|uniref:Uncharacterized protein n=1 Tax=Araneus ventricosus TaxID=182803 RepID=A0A4Y2UZ13_ARAVE|nr:hypothetical protein AVEN_160881-1 [Araneus ventricosus]
MLHTGSFLHFSTYHLLHLNICRICSRASEFPCSFPIPSSAASSLSQVFTAFKQKTSRAFPLRSPYIPDLAPSDFHLFLNLKELLGVKRFGSGEELENGDHMA